MANLELSKANKIKVLNSFPSSFVGKEGDLIISKISGKGKYLCAKVGGTWFAADKLNELNRLTTPKMSDLTVNSLKAGRLSILNKPVGGEIDLSAGDLLLDVAGDITLDADGGDLYFKDNGTTLMQLSANEIDIPSGNLTLDVAGDIVLDADGGDLYFKDNDITLMQFSANEIDIPSGDLTVDVAGDIKLDAGGLDISFLAGGTAYLEWNASGTLTMKSPADVDDVFTITVGVNGNVQMTTIDDGGENAHLTLHPDGDVKLTPETGIMYLYDQDNDDDYAKFTVGTHGDLTLTTVDAAAAAAHITLFPDGDLILDPASQKIIINPTDKLYFDGGTDTSIHESSADVLAIHVGGDLMMQLSEKGTDGNEISFGQSCVGFTQQEPIYNATNTEVDFRHSNKQNLTFGGANITNLKITFPSVSGNFVLLIKQDGIGSRTITNYRVYEFDETTADGELAVKFAGGSNPTLTTDANHVDILSFYWDADNEIAYGVATLDFQF